MKKLFALIGMCLIVPIVYAAYGGDTVSLHSFDECVHLTVNVTGNLNIDSNEYWLHNCTETEPNLWFCHCEYSSFDLVMTTQVNTINNYTFYINYITKATPTTTTTPTPYRVFFQRDRYIEEEVTEPEEIVIEVSDELVIEEEKANETECIGEWCDSQEEKEPIKKKEEKPEEEKNLLLYGFYIIALILLILMVWDLYNVIKKKEEKDERKGQKLSVQESKPKCRQN